MGTLRSLGEGGYASAFAVRSRLWPTKVGGFRPTKRVERCHGRKAVGLHAIAVTSRENINKAYPELKRLQELVQDPAALSRRLGKLADELAKDPELRRVVERFCDTLRKGRRPKRSIRHA